ncbi:hypothetical protein [Frigidibacter sp. MR17.24]|uniref:hypothetical protein n=1 Tax=Frigidibacter sp. MR17.24 TaxID=3127345 RepID=UPI003012EC64
MTILADFRREDGSYVITVNGLPYHVTAEDPLFSAVDGSDAPLELPPEAPVLSIEEQRAAMSLTDLQFAMAAAGLGLMTTAEAEAWVARGELPVLALTAISALPEAEQPFARIRFAGARTIERLDPFMPALQAAAGLTDEQVDALFAAGAAL